MAKRKARKTKEVKLDDRIREFLKLTVFRPLTLYNFGDLGLLNGEQFAHMMITAVDKADRKLKHPQPKSSRR